MSIMRFSEQMQCEVRSCMTQGYIICMTVWWSIAYQDTKSLVQIALK